MNTHTQDKTHLQLDATHARNTKPDNDRAAQVCVYACAGVRSVSESLLYSTA